MNTTIFFHNKTILIQEKSQNNDYQLIINAKGLKKDELFSEFKKFINQNHYQTLVFETTNPEKKIDDFKKAFKVIYAAGGLIKQHDKYLFIFRLKKWDLPKGKLDMGESPEEAAIRECEEECGITNLTLGAELEPTFHIYEHKGGYALKKTYWYNMTTTHTGPLVPQIEESIEEVKWFAITDIETNVKGNTYPAILNVLKSISEN